MLWMLKNWKYINWGAICVWKISSAKCKYKGIFCERKKIVVLKWQTNSMVYGSSSDSTDVSWNIKK